MLESNKNTIVIEAVFCCGKSFICKNELYSQFIIRDVDEEIYPSKLCPMSPSRIRSETNLIKSCIGNTDFVLSAVRYPIIEFMCTNKIPYILVYPEPSQECYNEWEIRNKNRDTSDFWEKVKPNFFTYVKQISHDRHAIAHIKLNKDQYLSDVFDQIIEIRNSYYK